MADVTSDILLGVVPVERVDEFFLPKKEEEFLEIVKKVSDMENYLVGTQNKDAFNRDTVQCLDLIVRYLAKNALFNEEQRFHENQRFSEEPNLGHRVSNMEKEIMQLRDYVDKTCKVKKPKEQKFSNEAYDAIRKLQDEVKGINTKLAQHSIVIDQNKLCSESLYDFVREMDHKKVDSRELNRIREDILQRIRLIDKVDEETFKTECQELRNSIEEVGKRFDVQRELQLIQMELTQRTLELVNEKLEKKECFDLFDAKISEALKKFENKVKRMIDRTEEGTSGAKKPMLRNLHCISCNNDVVMRDKMDTYFLPTAIRVEAINTTGVHNVNRYCGGSNTTLGATQRIQMMRRACEADRTKLTRAELHRRYDRGDLRGQNPGRVDLGMFNNSALFGERR